MTRLTRGALGDPDRPATPVGWRGYQAALCLPLFVLVLAVSLVRGTPSRASDSEALQILDHLYMSNGVPIVDMMAEMEVSELPPNETSGNLEIVSTDKLFFKKPNKIREDSTTVAPGSPLDGLCNVAIRDGSSAYVFSSLAPRPIRTQKDIPTGSIRLPVFLPRYPQDANKEFEVVKHEKFEGVPTTVLRVTTPLTPPEVLTVWVDTAHWVPLKTERTITRDPKPSFNRQILYSDIRKTADGRWFPLHIEEYHDNVLVRLMVYKTVTINSGLPDVLFDPMAWTRQ